MKNKRNYQQLHQISTATLLEESTHLRFVMQGIIAVAILVVALIIWAAFSSVEETAVTYGEVIPEGQIQIVQHLEGGVVSKVFVNNGEKVNKGDSLINMDPKDAKSELLQLQSREITLTLNQERLRAFLKHQNANKLEWSSAIINSKYNTIQNKAQISNIIADERQHLVSQYNMLNNQSSVLQAELMKKKEQFTETKSQIKVWDKHLKLLNEEFQMYHKLKQQNYVSHRDYLVVVRELNKAKGESVTLQSKLEQAQQDIKETQSKLKQLKSTSHEAALNELGKASDILLETRHKIEKLEERVARANITAPVTGIVKGIKVFAGNVVAPGGILLEVVPLSDTMLVESRVNPQDIGHIHIGDQVKIKVLTYDFARYGAIMGKLAKISASTFDDEDGKPYYKATINLDKQYVGEVKNKKVLKPGMTVQADVVTGKKTVLQYMLKPIHRARDGAFTER